ncbi:putative reverse transcriptase domain-containing protein [Tanacetum coccineum]
MAEALRARDAVRNLGPLMGEESGQKEVNGNGGNRNGDNGGNGNGDNRGNGNGGNRGNGNGDNGGNGNKGNGGNENGGNRENGNRNRNRNHGMNYGGFMPVAQECTFQDFLKCKPHNFSGTEGVNSYKRTIGIDAAYAMKWAGLMRLMTEVYCLRNEIHKIETELMVPDEEDRVERFIGGLPDNIQGNGYAARSAENKRRMEGNPRDNHGQQPPFKRQNVSGQNMARAYTAGNNKRKGSAAAVPNTQRAPLGNQQGVICYECRRPGHVKRECPKLRNQNHGNRVGNKTGNQTGGNEATAMAYAIGGGGTNPDSNVVTGTFLFNNCYASMLFDSRADRSFVSSIFSALLDVAPSTLDTSYALELADGRILETTVVLEYHALIICDEKVVRITYGEEVLIIRCDNYNGGSKLNVISYTRTQKYIHKGCQVYLAQVTSKKVKDKLEEKRLEDMPIVWEFSEVFPEDLPRLPPARQVEFQIDLVLGAAPIA